MNEALPAETTVSHYRILSRLGTGGMGEVYLAQDTTLDRQVAIKVLPSNVAADPERKRRFLREAKAASALNHPNICVIHEVGETPGGRLFIVMEYIEGETLQGKIGQRPVEAGELVRIALQAADAMDAAHARGITHRDVKPANLMITPRGQVKVLDFGLAKVKMPDAAGVGTDQSTASKTDPSIVMGTVQYMSPEQALGRGVDSRSDVFSLGVVLYEMATGRLPFAGATTTDTIEQIAHGQPEAISRFNYTLPIELERIVRKCLEKDRDRRYQSARELTIDLQNLQRDTDAGSGVKSATGRTSRQRIRWALVAATVALLGVASAGLYYRRLSAGQGIDSMAVLPFVNANADPNLEYLADGIPESIINSLSQLSRPKVMSRTSAFTFKGRDVTVQEVAQKLGVRAVVTGRIAQRGDSLVINIELIDARDNSQIWGQHYNPKLADVFSVQEEMATEISDKLRVKLTGAERQRLAKRPTENLKAFEYYMQGRAYTQRRTREDLRAAIHYCEQALAEDRNYALAYAGLGDAYMNLGVRGYIPTKEGLAKAEEATDKALALDADLAEAHVVRGQILAMVPPWDFRRGDAEFLHSKELSPSLGLARQYLAFSYVRQGRLDESLTEFLEAQRLDPLSSITARGVAASHFLKRDYPQALALLRKANQLGPAFSAPWEVGIYVQNGLLTEALAELERAERDRHNDPVLIHSKGMVYAAQGKRTEALAIIKELEAMSGPDLDQANWIAKVYAALDDREAALSWLDRGLAARALGIFYKDEPVWDRFRTDRRFADLLRRMDGTP